MTSVVTTSDWRLRRGLICRRRMVAGAGATDAGPEPRNRLEGEERPDVFHPWS